MPSDIETKIGTIAGSRVLLNDANLGNRLFKKFFGKPVGVSKPSPLNEYNSPFVLSLYEALYLCKRKEIESICSSMFEKFKNIDRRFYIKYRVYEFLRDRGYIVRSGIKFGTDFSVYELGPGFEHAPYVVTVVEEGDYLSPVNIVGFGRLSHSVRKRSVLAIVSDKGDINFLAFKWIKI